jgi:DNA ligase-1
MSLKLTEIFNYFDQIQATTKRLEMRDKLAELLSKLSPEEAATVSYLLLGRVAPYFIDAEFNVAGKTLEKVAASILGYQTQPTIQTEEGVSVRVAVPDEDLRKKVSQSGDLGTTLEQLLPADKKSQIDSVREFYDLLWKVIAISGTGSQQVKQVAIMSLIQKLSPIGAKYVIRIMSGKLRLGASDKTILDALASLEDDKSFAKEIREFSADMSDIGHIVYLYKKYGREMKEHAIFTPGVPVNAKLVEREATIDDVFNRIPEPIIEPKYDGLRLQIHIFPESNMDDYFKDRVWYKGYKEMQQEEEPTLLKQQSDNIVVKLFSRNLEDMTEMFPEICDAAKKLLPQLKENKGIDVQTLVLDGEIIGYNSQVEQFLTYQETMTRRRKHNVSDAVQSVPVRVFVFDVLFVGDENYMKKPLNERKEFLGFLDTNRKQDGFVQTPAHYVKNSEEAEKIFQEYIAEGLEGVIFKSQTSIYEPGKRNFEWIKFKRAMRHELADTVDLVLLGYYYGEGRLAKFGIGALLAGIYDKENDSFLTVTKIGTGITDELWQEIKTRCDQAKIDHETPRAVVPNSLKPDVWLNPEIVVEVEADEITKSPLHSSEYALRFPRFVRFREKKPEDATTKEELKKLCEL